MDNLTISAYDSEAKQIADKHENLIPVKLYQLMSDFFVHKGKSLDIGCGSGRDAAWLAENNYDPIGIDASIGMLKESRRRHPQVPVAISSLPGLSAIMDNSFSNVLCSAVLMHLNHAMLPIAARNIVRIMQKESNLIISYRGTSEMNNRENGKLYEPIKMEVVINIFTGSGAKLIYQESEMESGRNFLWNTFVFRK